LSYSYFRNILIVFLLTVTTTFAGYYFGRRGFDIEIKKKIIPVEIINRQKIYDSKSGPVDFSIFWEVWDLLTSKHLDRPLDTQKLFYGALKGLTDSIDDPYTSFLTPPQNESLDESLNGKYEGIGAELGKDENGNVLVVSPLEGSPAKASGLKPKDVIVKIDGETALGISLSEAVSKIRGPKGTVVVLTIVRKSEIRNSSALGETDETQELNIAINRDKITIKSVEWFDKGDGIALLKVNTFGENTNADWDNSVLEILRVMPNLSSVIVDVRNNPGGYLTGSIYLASEFIKDGVVVYEEFANGQKNSLEISKKGRLLDIPIVVLVNEGSASASEILAGALRDRNNAVLVGKKSFGKGTVQDSTDFKDGSAIHITIAKWLTPNKTWVHNIGLEVDYEIEDNSDTIDIDEQVEKAVEVAKGF